MTGTELAAIRKAAGLSQTELAQRVGIGRHAVSYWENKPDVDLHAHAVSQMARVLPLPEPPSYSRESASWDESYAERLRERDRQHRARLMAQYAAVMERARARAEAMAATRRVTCGAKTRKGTPCRMKSEPGKRRCKFHGGKSTGARTPEGIERIREAQRRRWARWRAERDAERD
ncbi:helix-turn-helix domain-containing protein [Celeribacter neptunius]|uniref:helix-turn-helix domain-containing protein n=1 Tax=Celeribacter neptunius TaxID=588602 RepID=UPI000A94EA0A|nr:helix-turn-helix transcriptional regulator [Celeribacter neptunius]